MVISLLILILVIVIWILVRIGDQLEIMKLIYTEFQELNVELQRLITNKESDV